MKRFNRAKLTEVREREGLSISDLGRRLNKSRQLISAWETGASQPLLDSVVELAEEFNVDIEFFINQN